MSSLYKLKPVMYRRLWLTLWLFGIFFPMAFLGSIWPAFGRLFNAVFAPVWMHVIMHAFLYCMLAILLTLWFRFPSIQSSLIIMGLAFLAGCIHESLQILAAGQWPGWTAEIFDLGVDICGAWVGITITRLWTRRKKKATTSSRVVL